MFFVRRLPSWQTRGLVGIFLCLLILPGFFATLYAKSGDAAEDDRLRDREEHQLHEENNWDSGYDDADADRRHDRDNDNDDNDAADRRHDRDRDNDNDDNDDWHEYDGKIWNSEERQHYQEFLVLYEQLLERYVTPGAKKEGIFINSVDYAGWADDERHQQAMFHLLKLPAPPSHTQPGLMMAFWINIYNFLTIDLIVEHRERESIRNLGGFVFNVWKREKWDIFGDTYNLDEIEHDILRPMDEPRIHYAISCASLSCPDLSLRPFREKGLVAHMEKLEEKFVNDPTKGIYLEFGKNNEVATLRVSPIFKWYKRDYSSDSDIIYLLKKYKNVDLPRSNRPLRRILSRGEDKDNRRIWREKGELPKYVKFFKYNWGLNGDW